MVRVHQVHPLERGEQPGDAQIEGAARAVQIDRVEQAIARRRAPGRTRGAGRIPGIAGALDCAVFHTDRLSGCGLRGTERPAFFAHFARVPEPRACVGMVVETRNCTTALCGGPPLCPRRRVRLALVAPVPFWGWLKTAIFMVSPRS